jgi:hypothetical protein
MVAIIIGMTCSSFSVPCHLNPQNVLIDFILVHRINASCFSKHHWLPRYLFFWHMLPCHWLTGSTNFETSTLSQNVRNYTPSGKESYPRKMCTSATPLQRPKKQNLTTLTALCNRTVLCFLGGGNQTCAFCLHDFWQFMLSMKLIFIILWSLNFI